MSFKFEVIEPKLFAGAAADEVSASVLDVLSEKERCSLSLAGGSTPVSVYRALTVSPRDEEIPWEKLDLLFGDERWVPHSDNQSNMHMVTETLLTKLSGNKPKVFPVNTSLPTPKLGAEDYERCISEVVDSKSNGCPQLDIVLLGMGEDGHTASVFPGSPLLSGSENQSLVAVEDWPNQPGAYRITMTPRLLLAAKKILFLVNGANKAEMIAKAFDDRGPTILPVHMFRAVKEKVTWLLDSESAKLLKT